MSLTKDHKPLFGNPVGQWHYWFAWKPVKTWDGRTVWLKRIERRLIQKSIHLNGPDFNWYEYHYGRGYV